MFVCGICKGRDVQTRMWVDINTNEVVADCEDHEYYCGTCEQHYKNNSLEDPNPLDYKYEMYLDSKPHESIQIHGWYPITYDRIKDPSKIDHYIETGLLRVREDYNGE